MWVVPRLCKIARKTASHMCLKFIMWVISNGSDYWQKLIPFRVYGHNTRIAVNLQCLDQPGVQISQYPNLPFIYSLRATLLSNPPVSRERFNFFAFVPTRVWLNLAFVPTLARLNASVQLHHFISDISKICWNFLSPIDPRDPLFDSLLILAGRVTPHSCLIGWWLFR